MARNGFWRLLRMAVLRARRVAALKRATFANFLVCGGGGGEKANQYLLDYREHEFSFGSTPLFRLGWKRRQSRPTKLLRRIACFGEGVAEEEEEEEEEDMRGAFWVSSSDETTPTTTFGGKEEEYFGDAEAEESGEEEEGVDARAALFIARFYDQLSLQRQISYVDKVPPRLNG